jgi:hypothetical protein
VLFGGGAGDIHGVSNMAVGESALMFEQVGFVSSFGEQADDFPEKTGDLAVAVADPS